MNLFLTGTDTGVGKTYCAALLVRGLRRAGFDTAAMKPICCGGRQDAELLRAAAGDTQELNEVNPVWLSTPASPYAAAQLEKRDIDLDLIRATYARLRKSRRSVIVEGVGGWLVPIARDYFVADLAADLGLPVAVVARNRLGALNHALLTVRAIQARGLECAGIIWNNAGDAPGDEISPAATAGNRAILEELAGVPILFDIAQGQREIVLGVA
ncbi:MAG TPA: dethiobiotin synthase [Chthoniobacteraceae bacterium]|nr:dethiobiotin synthase [Chthoniobacteraceae bacterium]